MHRFAPAIAALGLMAPWAATPAAELADLQPSNVFVQGGAGHGASSAVIGASWDWPWRRSASWGSATGYWEASFGRWEGKTLDGTTSSAWATQFGLTPVFRLEPTSWPGWFLEAGIGLNVIAPIYRSEDKRFSTAFNFGDHLAIGRRFGESHQHELALRVQHFSNGGIKDPNPGENFIQIRYSHSL